MQTLDYWQFIAGLGLFLYGMVRLKDALKQIAGKGFKLFLRKYTTNRFLAILNGALASAILQSSSLVLLMVIAFVGAGIISLSNSLGIILGANLGTTMTGWLVSLLGFNTKIENYIFPLIGIGSLGLIFTSRKRSIYFIFSFIIAVGLLFMGLGLMKTSMAHLSQIIDINNLKQFGLLAFFAFGFFVTALIQSSSAMMTITLSALYANIITLVPAMFIAIGADLGTTMTALIASSRGTPAKKRVGLAHFFFNVCTAIVAAVIAVPAVDIIQNNLKISDPLFALVTFHSGFNAIGIILFVPFLGLFEKFLNKFFIKDLEKSCVYIHKVGTEVPEAAIESIRLELKLFLNKIFQLNLETMNYKTKNNPNPLPDFAFIKNMFIENNFNSQYNDIKKIEGELINYITKLQQEQLDPHEASQLSRFILILRNGVQSAKSIKDIEHNIREFNQSVNSTVEEMLQKIQSEYLRVIQSLEQLSQLESTHAVKFNLNQLESQNESAYQNINKWLYQKIKSNQDTEFDIATLLNVNREIYNSHQLLASALVSLSEIE